MVEAADVANHAAKTDVPADTLTRSGGLAILKRAADYVAEVSGSIEKTVGSSMNALKRLKDCYNTVAAWFDLPPIPL